MIFNRILSEAKQSLSLRKEIVTLLILLSGALLFFGAVLLTSQKYVDGDEAVVGIMAKHILTKGEFHLFFYGQVYGGGGAIEAYLAAIPFAIFGVSSIALKSVALCFWLVTITLCYLFCLRRYNCMTAIFSTIILITTTALIEWHLKMRGGYAAFPLFFMIILICFSYLIDSKSQRGWQFLFYGLFCGIAYYNLEIIIPFLFTLLLFSLFWPHIFWKPKHFLLSATGFIVGSSPLLIFNLTHKFINFRFVFAKGGEWQNIFSQMYALMTKFLPRFFVGRNVDQYVSNPPITAYFEYIIYLMLFIYLIMKIWRLQAAKFSVSFLSYSGKMNDSLINIDTLLVTYLVIHLIFFSFSGSLSTTPRYLLPLFPALAIVAARGVNWLCLDQNRKLNFIGTILMTVLVVLGSINNFAYIGNSLVNDEVHIKGQGVVNRQTSGETISKIIDFLKARHIFRVRCTYFVQWRLLFESNENIIASSKGLTPGMVRYPLYDAIVDEYGGPQAIILHKDDSQLPSLKQALVNGYESEKIGEYVILIPKY